MRRVALGDDIVVAGPGTLSFDGERDIVLAPDDRATLRVTADGPRVIDVDAAMTAALAARRTTNPTSSTASDKDD